MVNQKSLANFTKSFTSFIKQHGFVLCIFLISPYLVLIPLFKYESWPGGHDCTTTIFSSWNIVKTLHENLHFPYNWQVEDHEYNGCPFFRFYQPLSYYMVYFMSVFTSLFDKNYLFSAMKSAVYLSFFISEIGMYFLLRKILNTSSIREQISVFGALAYLIAPYRFIDLYSRNTYSELWIFPWLPVYLLGFYKLFFLKEIKGSFLLAFSTACLFLSHLMPSFFFILTVHLGFLIFLILKGNLKTFILENKKILLWWLAGNFIALCLAGFYLLPAISSIKYCVGDTYGFDRVNLKHVLEHIPWCTFMLDPMNLNTEKWQVGQLFLFSFLILNFMLFTRKLTSNKDILVFLNLCVFLTLLSLMSKTLWEHLPETLYTLQFTWRLFVVYSFLCSAIAALIANQLNLKIPFLILLLGLHYYTGQRYLYYGGEDMIRKYSDTESWINKFYREDYTTANGGISYGFVPKTAQPVLFNFKQTDELGYSEKHSNTYLLNVKPGTQIVSLNKKGSDFTYKLQLENPEFFIFKQYFYPTWELYIDSKRSRDLYLTESGYIGFEVSKGRHVIKLRSN